MKTKKTTTTLYELVEFLLLVEARESASLTKDLKIANNLKKTKQKNEGIDILSASSKYADPDEVNAPSKPIKRSLRS